MDKRFPRQKFYLSTAMVLTLLIFIAPPLLIEDANWVYRRNWYIWVYPLIIFSFILGALPGSNKKPTVLRKLFSSPVPGVFFAVLISLPFLLVIPTLNGNLDEWGMQNVASSFTSVGEALVPAIRRIRTENLEDFTNTQIVKGQAIHSFTYFSYTMSFILSASLLIKNGKIPISLNSEYRDTWPYNWMDNSIFKVFMFLMFSYSAWNCYTGWGQSTCSDPDDVIMYTSCALGDDLLLYANAHWLAIGLVFSLLMLIDLLAGIIPSDRHQN